MNACQGTGVLSGAPKVAKLTRIVRCQFSEVVTQNIAPMLARFIKRSQERRERHERLAHQRQGTRDSVSHSQTPKGCKSAVACWSTSSLMGSFPGRGTRGSWSDASQGCHAKHVKHHSRLAQDGRVHV